ncbi:MAG: hypothetical protein IT435_01985 [Phycisphaerales bacterium]|nr:hypothetical protein [Phycisphaerales bacterium]
MRINHRRLAATLAILAGALALAPSLSPVTAGPPKLIPIKPENSKPTSPTTPSTPSTPTKPATPPKKPAESPRTPTPTQPTPPPAEPPPPISPEPTITGPLTPDEAMKCFALVERWVRSWQMPTDADVPPALRARINGASITLRYEGKIVGRGTSVVLLDAGPSAPMLTLPLVAAAIDARSEAADRLPGDHDAFRPDRIRQLAAQITISLEVCGQVIAIDPLTFDQVDRELNHGLDGVAVRIGVRTSAMFPATMLTRDISPADGLAGCISQATEAPELGIRTNPLTQPSNLKKSHEAAFYRFRPMQIVQISPGAPGRFLHRGGRVVDARDINIASMGEWATALADRLIFLSTPDAVDISDPPHPDAKDRICLKQAGTVWPAKGEIDPTIASAPQQATVAMALGRFAQISDPKDLKAALARNTAVRLLRDLLEHASFSATPADADKEAITRTIAYRRLMNDLTYEQQFAPWHTATNGLEIARWDPAFRLDRLKPLTDEKSPARELTNDARGQLAYALVLSRDPEAGNHIRDIYRSLGINDLASAMPWIGWADLTSARDGGAEAAIPLLREWRDSLYQRMTPSQAPGSDNADLAGGLRFPGDTQPTSQTARCAAILATMLRDPALTDSKERPKELSRLLALLRFLRQLTLDDYSVYSAQNRDESLGGVRRSLTEQRLDPEDSAITLIAVCETLESLDAMTRPVIPPTKLPPQKGSN